jgi:nitrogen fixation NifU-like protein
MGDRGPWITIWLRAVEGVVEQASFASQGCGVATACGSILTELIEGKSLPECLAITLEDVERALEWIPADKRYCAEVAVRALAMAAGGGVRVS